MNAIVSLCHFCEVHGPRILFCTQPLRQEEPKANDIDDTDANLSFRLKSSSISSNSESISSSLSTLKDGCEGCRSVRTGFVTHDEEANVSYASTQQPYNPEIFTRIRQACIRSLSCEVCPGREGPIFFGDQQCGQVLSYTFYIQDSQARGLTRWYSIMVVMMDKIYLLNSWCFLVPQIHTVIENLQKKATKVYELEEAKCPQKPYRLGGQVAPSNFIKLRGGNKPARSLPELTGDKQVFSMLHVAFLYILKACGSRITETLLEGPPMEDSIIDMENQEETEEGFIKVNVRKVAEGACTLVGDELKVSVPDSAADSGSEPEVEDVVDDPNCPVIKSLRHLRKLLGDGNFQALAHHIIIGNQVIISGHQRPLVKSFINVLRGLLPKGCCRVIPYSTDYQASYRCNFLGLSPKVTLPHHVNSSEQFVLLEIAPQGATNATAPNQDESDGPASDLSGAASDLSGPLSDLSGPLSDLSIVDSVDDFRGSYQFFMSSPVTLPIKVPTVLNRMVSVLSNKNLSQEVVESCLICLKEEWMNKVKVLFKFMKAGSNRSEEDMKRLLLAIGAREEDTQLLKFWMTGLSAQYRTHVLATSKQR